MSKYHSTKVITEAGSFDSKKEYGRWVELSELQKKGLIQDLQRQVTFNLIPAQRIDGKLAEKKVDYIADFVYTKDGQTIVEDVKPTFRSKASEKAYKQTAAYRVFTIKRKMMLYLKNIKIEEV